MERLVDTAESFQIPIAVCVNKWNTNPDKTKEIQEYCVKRGISFVGKIPYDKAVPAAVNAGKSVALADCQARAALLQIYEAVRNKLNI